MPEAPHRAGPGTGEGAKPDCDQVGGTIQRVVITVGAGTPAAESEAEEDDGLKPLSERLIVEPTTHRTLALRDALANDPGTFTAVLHALCVEAFYLTPPGTCLEISAKNTGFSTQAPGLADSVSAQAPAVGEATPKAADGLWETLVGFDSDSEAALFAHRASLIVNAIYEPGDHGSRRLAHADTLVRAVKLDMAAAETRTSPEVGRRAIRRARLRSALRRSS